MPIDKIIRIKLEFENPTTPNERLAKRKRSDVLSMVGLKSLKFSLDCMLPFRDTRRLSISKRFEHGEGWRERRRVVRVGSR